jgi:hypothetical protein
MNQAERKFALSIFVQGGHGPFRGLDAPFSAVASLMVLRTEVNRIAENVSKLVRNVLMLNSLEMSPFKLL